MNPGRLVAMANDIGSYFAAEPDPLQAQQQIADHLRRFWAPTMRRQLVALSHSEQAEALSSNVRQAVALLDEATP